MKTLMSLLCGVLFGFGLAMSGMTDRTKVIGFLDVFGQWQADLLFVMGGALLVTITLFRWILKRRPLLCPHFDLPQKRSVDIQLICGALLFGVGWGVYGYCPGPALAALSYMQPESFVFVLSMLIGMLIVRFFPLLEKK